MKSDPPQTQPPESSRVCPHESSLVPLPLLDPSVVLHHPEAPLALLLLMIRHRCHVASTLDEHHGSLLDHPLCYHST
ncbi:hypothetical protein RIF29_33832 [Crotalaria pallida]|uniref:Uncharacterized protein n=1 Tax=Crotalaria pallida TaxID=3830 RepID=A0AAN9E886_CROPI